MKNVLLWGLKTSEVIQLNNMVSWEELGYNVYIEYNIYNGSDYILSFAPDVLVISDMALSISLNVCISFLKQSRKSMRILALTSDRLIDGWASLNNDDTLLQWDELTAAIIRSALTGMSTPERDAPQGLAEPGWEIYDFVEQISSIIHESGEGYLLRILPYRTCSREAMDQLADFLVCSKQLHAMLDLERAWHVFVGRVDMAFQLYHTIQDLFCNQEGDGFLLYISDNLKDNETFAELLDMKQLDGFSYFFSNISLISRTSLQSVKKSFDYMAAGAAIRQTLIDLLESNDIAFVAALAALYLQSLKYSFDFFARMYLRNSLSVIYHTACMLLDLHCEPELFANGDNFEVLEQEYEYVCARFHDLLEVSRSKQINPKLANTLLIIANRYHEQLSLDLLADELSISKSYLCHLFKNAFRVGFVEYLNRIRITRACEQMADGETHLAKIAQAVGFNDSKYFTRVFKKTIGATPSEYIKRTKEQQHALREGAISHEAVAL